MVGVLKLLVDGNKCCISLLFLDVIELFEFLLQIFEDEYYSILYNIDTIFKMGKKIFGACFDAFRHFCAIFDFYFSFNSYGRDIIDNNYF